VETKTILIVDSDETTLRTFKRLLQNQGFKVDESPNKEDAIRKMKSKRYSIVLVSSMLPDIDGNDLFIFSNRSMQSVMKMVKVGTPFARDGVRALKSGADAVFAKPVAPNELLKALEGLKVDS
jgi:DNA-binding response OmpR family regulator